MAVLTCFVIQKNRDNLSDVVGESPKEKEWCTFCLIFLPLGKEIYPAHTNLEELILVLVKCYSFAAGKQPVPQSAAEPAVGRPAQSFITDYSHSLTLLLSSSSPQIINSVVLLILLSALTDPDQYHLTSAELGGEFEFMDDASEYRLPKH